MFTSACCHTSWCHTELQNLLLWTFNLVHLNWIWFYRIYSFKKQRRFSTFAFYKLSEAMKKNDTMGPEQNSLPGKKERRRGKVIRRKLSRKRGEAAPAWTYTLGGGDVNVAADEGQTVVHAHLEINHPEEEKQRTHQFMWEWRDLDWRRPRTAWRPEPDPKAATRKA